MSTPSNTSETPNAIRVMVCDESVFVRLTVSQLIQTDRAMLVVDPVACAEDLIARAARHNPDVVLVSPRTIGVRIADLLSRLKQECERVPALLICSPSTSAGGHEALQALADGAAEIVALDHSTLSGHLSELRAELLRKIRIIAAPKRVRVNQPDSQPISLQGRGIHLIAIGASSGGPPVLERILQQLPPQLPCPIIIAQQLPPMCTKALVERLDSVCAISIVHGEHGMLMHPGSAYIIPGTGNGRVRAIGPGPIRLEIPAEPPTHHAHPSINELFTSAAAQCAHHALGTAEILKAHGEVLSQTPASSMYHAMPLAAIHAGATPMSPDHVAATLASLAADPARRAA